MTKVSYIFMLLVTVITVTRTQNIPSVHEKNVKEMINPFRMAKINLIWDKALPQLSARKLVALMSELKIQDKQELTLKKLKGEGGDKEGQMEAQLRKSLQETLNHYKLGRRDEGDAPSGGRQKPLQALFKDKKLNKLWTKAEQSGFSQEELKALKEEFQHHQDKIDQYYDLLQSGTSNPDNELEGNVNKFDLLAGLEQNEVALPEAESVNALREKHRTLKDGYDRLHKLSASGSNSKEFIEPKVAGLWRLAAAADFTQEELESLHTELKHYENRLLKVRHLTGELLRLRKTGGSEDDHPDTDRQLEQKLAEATPTEGDRLLQDRLQKQRRTVDKMHEHLELRILQRHSEL